MEQVKGKSKGWTRFGVLFVISFLAVAMAMPAEGSSASLLGSRIGAALVPALIAWAVVRKNPPSLPRAITRGGSIILLFAGLMAIDHNHDAAVKVGLSQDAVDAASFSGWAGAFLALGLIGLFGSLFVGPREKGTNAAD